MGSWSPRITAWVTPVPCLDGKFEEGQLGKPKVTLCGQMTWCGQMSSVCMTRQSLANWHYLYLAPAYYRLEEGL